jgi:glycosyltransferase involved in cell wall biosynthesis
MQHISAFIITKNEASRVARAINSVKDIAEEIIVVDSGSVDDTVSIAENLGATVVFNEWLGYVKQKSFAESLCKNNWVLNIDADEELTHDLQLEIKKVLSSVRYEEYKAYEINFITIHRYDKKARLFAPSNGFIRLYDRNFCSFSNTKNATTHDTVTFNTNSKENQSLVYKFKNHGYHRSAVSIEQLVNKGNFYSTEQAKDLVSQGRLPSLLRIAFEFPLFFLKVFIIRRYMVFGFDGFIDSIIFAFNRFIRLAKTRELYKQKQIKD